MSTQPRRLAAIALAFVFAACTSANKPVDEQQGPTAQSPDPRIAVAQKALMPLKKNLKQALTQAVAEKGPVGAIDVCRLDAPKITEAASGEKIEVGRSALNIRNPKNAPAAWMQPLLEELSKAPMAEGLFRSTERADGSLGYMEPIYTGGLCLGCHGSEVAPEVRQAIDAAYPGDQAKGFSPGEFRGVFWAVVKP